MLLATCLAFLLLEATAKDYCTFDKPGYTAQAEYKFDRKIWKKRLFVDAASTSLGSGSDDCACGEEFHLEVSCAFLVPIEKKHCDTDLAYYRHESPFYLEHRGRCICYSGEFICEKKINAPTTALLGVHLFLGFRRRDSELLMERLQEKIGSTSPVDENKEITSAVQEYVSNYIHRNNKTVCSITMTELVDENIVLVATMHRKDQEMMKNAMSNEMKHAEKEECYGAFLDIADPINSRDAGMRAHAVMSMFKIASAEANVPPPLQHASAADNTNLNCILQLTLLFFMVKIITVD